MTLEECYQKLGGDYADVIGRLGSERLVQKFVLKFPDDGSYKLLLLSMEQEKVEDAFRAAHTIKGMCQNLGFSRLLASVSALTEALRAKNLAEGRGLLGAVEKDYMLTVEVIRSYQAGLPV